MKLLYSEASPYARKVLVHAHELGLVSQIELVTTNPFQEEAIRASNPLGKVPALIRDDGLSLFDSPVICDYLDSLSPDLKLIPAEGEARWTTLKLHAIAQGLTDAALNLRQNWMRGQAEGADDLPEDWYVERQRQAVFSAMDAVENDMSLLEGPLNLGQVAMACALSYWDFRFGDHPWRDARPRLDAWHAEFSARPSMQATQPKG